MPIPSADCTAPGQFGGCYVHLCLILPSFLILLLFLFLHIHYIFTFSYFSTSLQTYVHAPPTAASLLHADILTAMTAILNPNSIDTHLPSLHDIFAISSPGNTFQFLIHLFIPPPSHPHITHSHPQFIFSSFYCALPNCSIHQLYVHSL